MQIAGEPLAESMGRDLTGYSRDFSTPNVYFTPAGDTFPNSTEVCEVGGSGWVSTYSSCPYSVPDLVGFGTAVESYEYSKQPMNNLALESGAGTSYLFGPLVNPTGLTGAAALALVIPRLAHFGQGSNVTGGNTLVTTVDGTNPDNRLGWPGLWPTVHPYAQFDPTILPDRTWSEQCSISSDDDPNATGNILNLNYECDYNSLHLPNRATQLTMNITPGASGWAGWKYSLWVLNYLQSMHDSAQTAIATVPAGQLALVGTVGNTVTGTPSSVTGAPSAVAGTYLGSSDIEGFQAQLMIDELDNAAYQWLTQLTTTDGATLSGFPSVLSALQYNYASPLRWIPGSIAVTETPDTSGYPNPTGYAIADSGSHLLDLLGLAGSYASIYTLTDQANTVVGGSQPVSAFFDGDPFPAQNQVPTGSATLHDHALGVLRLLIVNIDRLHRDPTSGGLVDDVTFTGGTPTPGTTISTTTAAYSVFGLRTVRRALTSLLQLYSNNTPDISTVGVMTPLDDASLPLTGAPDGATLVSDRLTALINAESQLLLNHLTTADGHAYQGWNVSTNTATSTDDALDSYTAAIRGLLTAYLASGNTTYRDRALAVFERMDSVFYDPAGLVYVATPGAKTVAYTPMRFAVLEGSLRDLYELIGSQPGQKALGLVLQNRIARLIKLVLNGWDDLNGDMLVDYPNECITTGMAPGYSIPIPQGGLQMAERALSGELGAACDSNSAAACADAGGGYEVYTPDREKDCVPEISAVQLPSALANQITFQIGQ